MKYCTKGWDWIVSKPFKVKQSCVLTPNLFGVFFSLLLKHAFGTAEEGIQLHSRTDSKLFNPSRLKAKSKVKDTVIKVMLTINDAAIAANSSSQLQSLMDLFAKEQILILTISFKKSKVQAKPTTSPNININNY